MVREKDNFPCQKHEVRIVELEGKIDKNNELTLLEMKQIHKEINSLSTTMQAFITSCDAKYATKEDHVYNLEKINKLEKIVSKLNWTVILAVVAALLSNILK